MSGPYVSDNALAAEGPTVPATVALICDTTADVPAMRELTCTWTSIMGIIGIYTRSSEDVNGYPFYVHQGECVGLWHAHGSWSVGQKVFKGSSIDSTTCQSASLSPVSTAWAHCDPIRGSRTRLSCVSGDALAQMRTTAPGVLVLQVQSDADDALMQAKVMGSFVRRAQDVNGYPSYEANGVSTLSVDTPRGPVRMAHGDCIWHCGNWWIAGSSEHMGGTRGSYAYAAGNEFSPTCTLLQTHFKFSV